MLESSLVQDYICLYKLHISYAAKTTYIQIAVSTSNNNNMKANMHGSQLNMRTLCCASGTGSQDVLNDLAFV